MLPSYTTNYYADLAGAKANIVIIEKAITVQMGLVLGRQYNNSAAYPFMRYVGNTYPLWLNGTVDAKPDRFGTEGQDYEPFTVQTELQLGKITEGYDGKLEEDLDVWLPYTLTAFRAAERLTTAAAPNAPRGMLWSSIRVASVVLPGDVIGARFIQTLIFVAQGDGRD